MVTDIEQGNTTTTILYTSVQHNTITHYLWMGSTVVLYLILYNNEYDITLRLDYNQKTNIPYDIKHLISNCQNKNPP